MASTVNNPAWLEWMTKLIGGVSRQTQAAAFPPDRFYCLLDELPLHLVPQWAFSSLRAAREGELYLNPECSLRAAEDFPEEITERADITPAFALRGSIAWVRDTRAGSLLPFWIGPTFEEVIQRLSAGKLLPSSVPGNIRRALAGAAILIPQGHRARYRAEREHFIANARLAFREKGYATLPGLIHPFHIAALRRYYRCLIRNGWMRLGDEQSALRYVVHNEPVAGFFHRQIAHTLSAVAGETVKPSYVYLASYQSGAELKKHMDREQCEFSITLALDFSPEPKLATPWPIYLDTPSGKVTVFQALGDGLAYRGTRLPHYRDKLGRGQTSTSIFFHYVSEDFGGSLT